MAPVAAGQEGRAAVLLPRRHHRHLEYDRHPGRGAVRDGAARRLRRPRPGAPDDRAARQAVDRGAGAPGLMRSEENTSELQSLMRQSYAVFCLKKKINKATSYQY